MDYCGSRGVKVTPEVSSDLSSAVVHVETWVTEDAAVTCRIGDVTATAFAEDGYAAFDLFIEQVHLWNGKQDPYLYEEVCSEEILVRKVDQPNPEYSLPVKESVLNWFEADGFRTSRYSILDSINDLMANPATKDLTLEVLAKLDPAIPEVPGLLGLLGSSSIQETADHSDCPDCRQLLTGFNQKLQEIEKV